MEESPANISIIEIKSEHKDINQENGLTTIERRVQYETREELSEDNTSNSST